MREKALKPVYVAPEIHAHLQQMARETDRSINLVIAHLAKRAQVIDGRIVFDNGGNSKDADRLRGEWNALLVGEEHR